MQYLKIIILSIFWLSINSCNTKPRVIEAEKTTPNNGSIPVFKDTPAVQNPISTDDHKVVVEEILNTENFSYLNVSENSKKFWIAIPKTNIEIGNTYYYSGGLLKKDFFSKEHGRVFETVYLVSSISKQPITSNKDANGKTTVDETNAKIKNNTAANNVPINVNPKNGIIKLSELFSNMGKYNGKTIRVTGKIVKVNSMIMGRNWVHIRDGSGDKLDLTITTTEDISLGQIVTLEGAITLNKDFGAGYKYDIIMEEAVRR